LLCWQWIHYIPTFQHSKTFYFGCEALL